MQLTGQIYPTYALFCVKHSAKQAQIHEITPQSNYVRIFSDGRCEWDPRYEFGITQCDVNVKWFPFDKQYCDVTFASWLLKKQNIEMTPDIKLDYYNNESEDWWLNSEYQFLINVGFLSRVRMRSYTERNTFTAFLCLIGRNL